ncbi:epithelial splicing regulatory protein 2 [Dendroctonus ponderosae]|uniref:epithelial splicing regulatory protein 2 n=1 Tax=Dendroctonus ponderosae TaxID=77166 RepID=UPI00203527B2|nr:epithelial splicing regulatory protein 2 [Dendroctonus ponderosae]KAH1008189.1 hypothetical protein HUJ05_008770 [Dendroctonus ponderosae]
MSIIIRLQNLPWAANALDIRQFFSGLQIPEGGVHIVGGELGDAFIAFSTDEDARQAFLRNNMKIKGIQIQLMLSSRTEMQRVIEQARNQSMAAFMLPTPSTTQPLATPLPAAVPLVPAAVPEIQKDSDRKRDRRRSRSKSRDRRDRSRDRRDRRHRSRSKSRDRKDRRRGRDRSRSRNRSRDKDGRRTDRARSKEMESSQRKLLPEIWSNQLVPSLNIIPPPALGGGDMLSAAPWGLKTNLVANLANLQGAGFGLASLQANAMDSWPVNPPSFDSLMAKTHQASRDLNLSMLTPMEAIDFRNKSRASMDKRGNGRRSRFEDVDVPVDACVSLEPFYGSYGDLRRFFSGLSINYRGIKIINDEFGRKTGVSFVQFRDMLNKNKALTMNGTKLNEAELKIKHISDQVFEEAIDRYNPRIDDVNPPEDHLNRLRNTKLFLSNEALIKDFTCLKVEDLPTFVKDQDILHIFSQHPLISLHLNFKPKGGNVAYVKFSSKEVAKLALEETSHHVIQGKAVTVKACTDEEFLEANPQTSLFEEGSLKNPGACDSPVQMQPAAGTDCLSMSHLPSKTTDRDISDFFSDIGIIPTKIHLVSNNAGFTGLAYCEFETAEDASKGVAKDKVTLGANVVSVTPIARSDMEKILGSSLPHPGMGPGQTLAPGTPLPPITKREPEQAKDGSRQDNSDLEEVENQREVGLSNRFEAPPDRAEKSHASFDDEMYFEAPRNAFNGRRGGFFNNRGSFNGRGAFGSPRGGFRGRPGGPGYPPRGNYGAPRAASRFPPRRPETPDPEDIPGCTVFLDNVPYKAGTNEILDFFEGYNSTDNVSRRYNPDNTPSAEAKVSFFNPDDAQRAVEELNGKMIWGRSIYLSQQ